MVSNSRTVPELVMVAPIRRNAVQNRKRIDFLLHREDPFN